MSKFTSFYNAVSANNFVVLDTETSGLRYPAEILQIAICDFMGGELLNTLVRPVRPIPAEASAIHGLTAEALKDAPVWPVVRQQVRDAIGDKLLIIYNANFDIGMLYNSDRTHGINDCNWGEEYSSHCAMLWYADYRGEMNEYYGNPRWHKLSAACAHEKVPVVDAHDAMGDCQMTLKLIRAVIAKQASNRLVK